MAWAACPPSNATTAESAVTQRHAEFVQSARRDKAIPAVTIRLPGFNTTLIAPAQVICCDNYRLVRAAE